MKQKGGGIMERKLIALFFVALLVAFGVGYGLGYVLMEDTTRKVNVTNFPTSWTANVTNFPTSWTANVTNFPTSWTQSPPTAYTSISLGQKFNWSIAEVVDVQQNCYVYGGHDVSCVGWDWSGRPSVGTIHLAKWLNGWVELCYKDGFPQNVSLSPYTLHLEG